MISRSARLYFLPTGFVASPFGREGAIARLAGGLVHFSAYEVIAVDGGMRVDHRLVAVGDIDAFISTLPQEQNEAARLTIARTVAPRPPVRLGAAVLHLDQPLLMAILNITPDSFSDGGRHGDDPCAAAAAALAMAASGAAIIDVGAESTRPGAVAVPADEEIARAVPVVERLARAGAIVSIDTRKPAVMEAALAAGAGIVNDVSALCYDGRSAGLLARRDCPVVLMHHQGDPGTMQKDPRYGDALIEIYDWLADRIAFAEQAGIGRERIIVDPGIGFGKTLRHNLQILNGLALFHGLGCPILLGASRKRLIGALSDDAPVERRLGGSVALALHGAQHGAQILRVHDVAETAQAIRVWRGLHSQDLTTPAARLSR